MANNVKIMWVVCRMFEHFPLQGMELVLNSMGLVGMVTFVRHW